MIFLATVLIFIVSILTYSYYPRNDEYALHTIQDEKYILSFVNQHQVARDYMTHMLQVSTGNDTNVTGLITSNLIDLFPNGLTDDMTDDLHRSGEEEGYSSLVACYRNGQNTLTTDCINADNQYIITYGYAPNWWSDEAYKRKTWRKSIAKRTRNSADCGTLQKIGNNLIVDTTMKRTTLPRPITTALNGLWDTAWYDPDDDMLFCFSKFTNPYVIQNLQFHWDKINNDTTHHTNGATNLLQGNWTGTAGGLYNVASINNIGSYTISGVITPSSSNQGQIVLIRNTSSNEDVVQLSAANVTGEKYLQLSGICAQVPTNAFSFTYINDGQNPRLYINNQRAEEASNCSLKGDVKAPDFTHLQVNVSPYSRGNETDHTLANLKIYNSALTQAQRTQNFKADKKRYGIQ